MRNPSLSHPKKWILKGIPALFLLGSLWHFLYQILGECFLIGLIAPINESVWEHGKLVLWPIILWWSLYYVWQGKHRQIRTDSWFFSTLLSLVIALLTIPLLYYAYTGAFGVELLWVDILILLVALVLGQLAGLYSYCRGFSLPAKLVWLILLALVVLFAYFTLCPPHLPLFQDSTTGGFGLL